MSGPRLAASIQQDMAAAAGVSDSDAAALRAQIRDLEMDQQLMQRDMEELSKQAQQAVAALKCVLSDSMSLPASVCS